MNFNVAHSTKFIARIFSRLFTCVFAASVCHSNPIPTNIEVIEVDSIRTFNLTWATVPDETYQLWRSTDLEDWRPVEGQLKKADGPTMAFSEEMLPEKAFYQVTQVDTTPPSITGSSPNVDDFAIRRFEKITIALDDASGIDPSSVSLSVGSLGVFTLSDLELTLTDQLLTFDNGADTALGAYGEVINVTLTVADALGQSVTQTWSFTLELEPIVVENLLVFGSPAAQRAGQRVAATPTRALSQNAGAGPIRMNTNTSSWSISGVTGNSIIVEYGGSSPPSFSVGMYLTNLTPVSPEEFFYRQVTAVSTNPGAGSITLTTIDVRLSDILIQGSIRLDENALLLEQDSDGNYSAASALRASSTRGELVYTLPAMGLSYSNLGADFGENGFRVTGTGPGGREIALNVGDAEPPVASLSFDEFDIHFEPSIEITMEINETDEIVKSSILARGKLTSNTVVTADIRAPILIASKNLLPVEIEFEKEIIFTVGGVPIKIDFEVADSSGQRNRWWRGEDVIWSGIVEAFPRT